MLSTISGTAGLVGDRRHRRDIERVELGVADGLGVERLGGRLDRPAEVLRIGGVDEVDLQAETGQGVDEEVVGAAVEAVGTDQVVAGAGDVEDREGDGGGARGEGQRPDAALEGGHPLLEDVGRRVHDPRVDVAGPLQAEELGGVLGVVKDVGRGLVDRHGTGVGRRVRLLAGVQGEGLEPKEAR